MLKKVLVAAGSLVGLSLVALVGLPFLFKGRIEARVHTEVERAVDAQVDWSGVGLTFFRNFPNLALRLDHLTVVGSEPFAGDTLVSMKGFRLVLDAGSLIRGLRGTGPFLVRSVRLEEPVVHLRVLPDGASNWDIVRGGSTKAGSAEPSSRSLSVEFRSLGIRGGSLLLENAQTGLYTSMEGLQMDLGGDFSQERFVVRTRTRSDATTLRFAGMPYLEGVALDLVADLDADMTRRSVSFAENELRLNELVLNFSGSAARTGENVALDVTFTAPRTAFSQALSLVPVLYAHDFETLETSGSFSLQGRVLGEWGENALPAFSMSADVTDGMFRYPDLPLAARDIALRFALDNPGGDVDSTVVRLDGVHLRIGDEPIHGSLTLRTPVSDPDVDLRVRGAVDLADVARTVKLDDVEELTGVVRADAELRARLSDIDGRRYERVAARGNVVITDVNVRTGKLPQPIAVREATLELSPQRVEVRSLQMQLGSSDVHATGSVDNVLAFVLRGEDLRGSASFTSQRVDLDEWRSKENFELIPVPAGLDLALDGTVARLTFAALDMADAHGSLRLKDRRLMLDDFTMRTLGGGIGVSGFYETLDPAKPTFRVGVALDSLDIPSAAAAFVTLRMLAPVAGFTRGAFSAQLDLAGALGQGMAPVLDVLNGTGSLQTTTFSLEGFPALARLGEVLGLPQLANPTFQAISSFIEIRDGRLHVRPFQVGVGDFRMAVSGSNGVDQTLDYKLTLAVPRGALGEGAERAIQGLISEAGRAGLDLQAADSIEVSVGLAGTVTDPAVEADFQGLVTSAGDRARQNAGAAVEERIGAARELADSTKEDALRRARARADSIMQQAEEGGAAIRAEARQLADDLRAEADRLADQVLAGATNPVARAAARAAADRIRKEADERANAVVLEADRRADDLVAEARRRAEEILKEG
ncbi:MAG TPA: AsmA-like C-terminal region-containing protein [Longimicrobiales bacterium]|nr:AsmA-like C-terminal region-containing protein [Longimicrobiales bacterium]